MPEEEQPKYKYYNGKNIFYLESNSRQKDGAQYLTSEALRADETEVFFEYARAHSSGAPFMTKNGYHVRLRHQSTDNYEIID